MSWQRRLTVMLLACVLAVVGRRAGADAYDPPANYYSAATGTGATLKSQLRSIITTGDSPISYDAARSALQVTDAHPTLAGYILTVYDRTALNVAALGGSPPGWDPDVWNREHTWPRSRGVGSSGVDDSDLFLLRPSLNENNGDRGNLNFGGVFGTSEDGMVVTDGGQAWYPGNADAGMIARQQFFGAVRYDGLDSSTNNLELGVGLIADVPGTPDDPPPQLGDLNRLIEWHFAAPPDSFERRRNQVIYDQYQHNRNPFTDRPEYVWSVFKGTNNNSLIGIMGQPVVAGASTKNIDLGRVFVGGSVPAAQGVTLVKEGSDGTYYEVATSGAATSTVTGRLNAFRTGVSGITKTFHVGLNTTTTTAGLKSGAVTIDNLDITGSAGSGQGAGDGNDTINLSLAVVNHATPSFDTDATEISLMHDFGSVTFGSAPPPLNFSLFNRSLVPGCTVNCTADLDFDGVTPSGSAASLAALTTNLAASAGSLSLDAGTNQQFTAMLNTSAVGSFSATYTLNLSDENLPGALPFMLTLSLTGQVTAALLEGDYDGSGVVDVADYVLWRSTYGSEIDKRADGDGDDMVGDGDYVYWRVRFGNTSMPAAGASTQLAGVPEPAVSWLLAIAGLLVVNARAAVRRRRG